MQNLDTKLFSSLKGNNFDIISIFEIMCDYM